MKRDFSRRNRKGQSAIEYLTTYGWALLAIVIVGAVLMQMGVFSQCQTTTPRFSGQSVAMENWQYTGTNNITMVFTAVNQDVDLNNVTLDYGDGDVAYYDGSQVSISAGNSGTLFIDGVSFLSSGECASASVSLTADVGGISGSEVSSSGSMTGPVP
jgi:hypothetical protein